VHSQLLIRHWQCALIWLWLWFAAEGDLRVEFLTSVKMLKSFSLKYIRDFQSFSMLFIRLALFLVFLFFDFSNLIILRLYDFFKKVSIKRYLKPKWGLKQSMMVIGCAFSEVWLQTNYCCLSLQENANNISINASIMAKRTWFRFCLFCFLIYCKFVGFIILFWI